MGISSVDLMGSSVIINVPSPPSSSSSSSSSSRVHQMAENEGEDRSGMGLEGKIPDRNRFSKRLGREVPRLILDDLENERLLPSFNRGIEELDKGENQLNLEIEDLERKVVMLMIAKGLKGDEKLGKFGDVEDILKAMKLNDKLKEFEIGAEERRKRSGKDKISKPDIPRRKVYVQKIEKTGKVLDESKNVSDDNIDKDEKKLSKEIEILEAMLERGSYGLLDLQMMMEEVKAMKGSEKMVCEIKEKMTELESELWGLKNAIAGLKSKKGKQLMGRVKKEEETEMKYEKREQQEENYEEEEVEEDNGSKIKWRSIIASVGVVALAAAAVFFMGRSSSRVGITSEKKNRRQNDSC